MAERRETTPGEATHRSEDGSEARLPPEPGKDATQDEIVADIEDTREQLRETVDSLSAKLDVKGNAKARVDQVKSDASARFVDLKQRVRATYGRALESDPVVQARAKPAIPAGAAVVLVAVVVGVVVWRRRR